MNLCSSNITAVDSPCNENHCNEIKFVKLILVNKKAKRFLLNNIKNNDWEKINKQVKKGTVKIIPANTKLASL